MKWADLRGHRDICQSCDAINVWDRVRYLDERGDLTTYPNAKKFVESRKCLTCDHVQSLGPVADAPLDELEAAAMIADVLTNVEHIGTWQAAIGIAAYDDDSDPPTGCIAWMWHAGWLARHIWKEMERE